LSGVSGGFAQEEYRAQLGVRKDAVIEGEVGGEVEGVGAVGERDSGKSKQDGIMTLQYEWKPFSELLDFVVDNRGKSAPASSTGIPLIKTESISNENLYPTVTNQFFVSQETYDTWFRAHPQPGDIIVVNKGSYNGAVCLVPDPVGFCIAQDMVAVRPNGKVVNPLFLFSALRSPNVQAQIKNLNVSSAIPHFKKTDFDKLLIPYPPIAIQQEIGRIYYDFSRKIELNQQMNRTLEAIARAIFKSWFVDFDPVRAKMDGRQPVGMDTTTTDLFPDEFEDSPLGKIPKGWKVTTLGDVVSIKHGYAFKSEFFSEPAPGVPIVVNIGNFKYTGGFRFESTTLKGYIGEFPEEFILSPGDILLIMTCQTAGGEILGIPGRIPNDGRTYLHNQRMGKVVVTDLDRVDQHFLYQLFLLPEFNGELFATASGTKILHTSPGRIESFQFCLPPIRVQRAITKALRNLEDKISSNEAESKTLVDICDALLPKLLSGEICVKDADFFVEQVA
jgi:type I restriction enzyme S subunit